MSESDIRSAAHLAAERNRRALSPVERAALSMLKVDGWSNSTLAMVFEIAEQRVYKHYDEELGEELNRLAIREEL